MFVRPLYTLNVSSSLVLQGFLRCIRTWFPLAVVCPWPPSVARRVPPSSQHRICAESDAVLAVGFALDAIETAEYEVIDAVLARAEADALAAA